MKPAICLITLLATMWLTAPAAAQVQPLTAWWIDTGDTDSTGLGMGIAPLGDINQDGYNDFVAAGTLGYWVANLYVYLGSDQPDTVPDIIIPKPDSLKWFGLPTFNVGDVNGDGFSDIIATGIQQELPFPIKQYAYLYFGGPLLDTIPDIIMKNESQEQSDFFGYSGAGLGDINGDGNTDFAITDPQYINSVGRGSIYIYYGDALLDSIPDLILRSDSTLNWIGYFVEGLGDINGDGYSDWVMSDGQCQGPNGEFSTGVVAIYYGGNPPDTIPHTVIYGSVPGADLGMGLTTFDWDRDGQKDIFAWCGNFYPPDNHGAVWEFKVSPTMTGQPNHIFLGIPGYPGIGEHMFHTDLDGDGQQDLISGAPGYAMAGLVYVFLNGAGQDTIYDAYYYQGNFNQQLGSIGSGVGDINGDGIEDMAVSEPAYSGNGRLHMILGNDSLHQSVGVMPFPQPPLPQTVALLKASPNPFNSQVVLEISVPSPKNNQIKIYNLKGEEIRRFDINIGQNRVIWNGTSSSGQICASGIYLAKLTGPSYQTIQKLTLIR
jgi:hypothetical protein